MQLSEVLHKANKGSAFAQKSLFDTFAAKMLMVCRRYVKNQEDAEELMLNGFYKVFKNLSNFKYQGDSACFMWIKQIMVNECLMFLRKKSVFNLVSEDEAELIVVQEEALNNLSADEIFSLIIQLPVGYRTIFNLYAIEGMSHIEIAALLGIAEGTSKSQLSKAKNLLQNMLINNQTHYVRRQSK